MRVKSVSRTIVRRRSRPAGFLVEQLLYEALRGTMESMTDGDEIVEIPITDVFDLHSVPPRDVSPVVEAYLEAAREKDFRYVRIIHGKGIGVQREMVRKILERTPFVESFQTAPEGAGGWGATVVVFRPK